MLTAIKPKRRRVAIKEERFRAAVDAKRRRSRPAKTELAPRWSRRRRNVVRDVFDEDRRRRTGTLDGGGWVTLISAKGKGNDFRGVRFSERRNRRTSAQAESAKRRARRSERRLEKSRRRFFRRFAFILQRRRRSVNGGESVFAVFPNDFTLVGVAGAVCSGLNVCAGVSARRGARNEKKETRTSPFSADGSDASRLGRVEPTRRWTPLFR